MNKIEIIVPNQTQSILYGLQQILQSDTEKWLKDNAAYAEKTKSLIEGISWKCVQGGDLHSQITNMLCGFPAILYFDNLPDGWLSFLSIGVCGFVAMVDHEELPQAICTVRMGGVFLSQTYKKRMREEFMWASFKRAGGVNRYGTKCGFGNRERSIKQRSGKQVTYQ